MSGPPPRPTRVMHVLWRLSLGGGIPQVVRTVAARLNRREFDLHVCTARPLLAADRLSDLGSGITFHTLGLSGSRSIPGRLSSAVRLAGLIRRVRPDIVHIHSGVTWLLLPSMLSGLDAALVVEVHDAPNSGRVSRLNTSVERWVTNRPGATALVHSRSVGRDLATGSRRNVTDVRIVPIGIDTAAYGSPDRAAAWRSDQGVGPDQVLVSYVARLVPTKNPTSFMRMAIEVSREAKDAVFVLAGDGPLRGELTELAASEPHTGRIRVPGFEADLVGLLSASDVFVSTSDYEGFGIAILEAMASSTAVVATATGASGELVTSGVNGLLVPPGDDVSLSAAVASLIHDAPGRDRMAAEGRRRAEEKFDVDVMVRGYEALYRELAGRGQSDPT